MKSTPTCRAKNPNACRYHGSQSAISTAEAKLKMVKAEHYYRSLHENPTHVPQSDLYEAYENVNKARTDYYSTDEGLQIISEALDKDPTSSNRPYLTELQRNAQTYRYETEQREGGSPWEAPSRNQIFKLPPFPARIEAQFVGGVKNIASIKDSDGGTTHYRYSERGQVYIEYEDADGNYDVEYSRTIGSARTDQEAFGAAYGWFRKENGY